MPLAHTAGCDSGEEGQEGFTRHPWPPCTPAPKLQERGQPLYFPLWADGRTCLAPGGPQGRLRPQGCSFSCWGDRGHQFHGRLGVGATPPSGAWAGPQLSQLMTPHSPNPRLQPGHGKSKEAGFLCMRWAWTLRGQRELRHQSVLTGNILGFVREEGGDSWWGGRGSS